MAEYLYRVDLQHKRGWVLLSAEVDRRTPKQVYMKDRTPVTDFRQVVPAKEAEKMSTPRMAWEAFKTSQVARRDRLMRESQDAATAVGVALVALSALGD